ncbi:MAG: hypothetical protein QF619_12355 [Candidatus Binatia bacterium]|nr:hypothetical protein [Candidatus Binatia bacterium]
MGSIAIAGKNDVYFSTAGSRLYHYDGKKFKKIKYKGPAKRIDIRNFVVNAKNDI